MTPALEDNYEDILGKAMRGLELGIEALSARSSLSPESVAAQLRGEFSEPAARALAPILKLDADSLVAIARHAWKPEIPVMPGVHQVSTPWKSVLVNAYAVWDDNGDAALFDAGADAAPLIELAGAHGLTVHAICITHSHGDHVGGLAALRRRFPTARVYSSAREPIDDTETINAGTELPVSNLRIESRLTWGHSPGGLTYVVRGLGRPVAVVGDALFAGSMGGGNVSWSEALATNRREIFTLPDNTVICPGHGPMTTVGQEKAHNPFYPEFKD
jgi:glyoxylase-like metal-dependent hydrolase (beta-lactamase superfamily II)